MAERIQCEFFLIRYVPDVVKGEFTNIGVLLREAGRDDSAVVRFTRDWSRVRCMDADADIGLLEALEGEIAERLRLGAAGYQAGDAGARGHAVELAADHGGAGLPGGERAGGDGTVDAMYVEPLKVKQERQQDWAGGDRRRDADGV